MNIPNPELVAAFPNQVVVNKDTNPETTLGSAYSPVDYMSITSFPRLPEDDAMSGDNALKSHKDDDKILSEQDADPDLFLKSARLQRLPSSASDLASHDVASLQETTRDPFVEECACQRDGLTVIITACLTFATGVTVALIMQIYLGDPQVFYHGAVVTDAAQCTSLGFDVLEKQGSSVDAAIAAALCLGIVHPHTSGIGGGGIMLVHNIRKNETRVIDFRETAPSAIQEDMMLTNLDLQPGLLVGVPGMLSGMHQAHQLYGSYKSLITMTDSAISVTFISETFLMKATERSTETVKFFGCTRMPWKDVVSMAADVATNGFNVTHDLAEALAKVKDQNMSDAFLNVFLPNGQAPLSGLFSKRPDLAAILNAVAENGISEFYSGNLAQEMAAAVQLRGGVLTEEDLGNYSTVLQKPAEIMYQGHHVMAAPAPHAGVALITALNILEGYNITGQVPRNVTYHWIAEAVKIALALASELGDPLYESTVAEVVERMLSKPQASLLRQMINDSQAFPASHYTSLFTLEDGAATAQVMVMGPDDHIVSVISSLNKPFGSGIVTPSGILLNSQILDFSWPNKSMNLSPNPHNIIQPGKRPMSFLMPTAVRPAVGLCGTYVVVGSSNGEKALSGITQVLMNVLSSRRNMSDSVAYGRLHPQLQPNTLLVDAEFLDEDVELLQAKGHMVQRTDVLSLVESMRRNNDLIIGVKDPRSADASALNMSFVH